MMLSLLALVACVEDVAKDKVEAEVAEVEPKEEVEAPEAAPAATGEAWMVDASQSKIEALGAKVTATHPIVFPDYEGKVMVADGKVTGVEFTVQMGTLAADVDKLTEHLKTGDFFDVAQFPTAGFTSSMVKEGSDAEGMTHTITGEFTIHGMTKQITFPAKVEASAESVSASTEFALDRQDFGVTYPGMPDDLIQDKVVLTIELTAAKPSA